MQGECGIKWHVVSVDNLALCDGIDISFYHTTREVNVVADSLVMFGVDVVSM